MQADKAFILETEKHEAREDYKADWDFLGGRCRWDDGIG
jgi:hypothetical protein